MLGREAYISVLCTTYIYIYVAIHALAVYYMCFLLPFHSGMMNALLHMNDV
jgi:hypothetical protein